MAVSTATAAWQHGTLITATGTPNQVLTELALAGSSKASFVKPEDIIAYGFYWSSDSSAVSMGAMWYSTTAFG